MIVLRNLPAEVLENLAKIGKSRLSDFGREAGGSGRVFRSDGARPALLDLSIFKL